MTKSHEEEIVSFYNAFVKANKKINELHEKLHHICEDLLLHERKSCEDCALSLGGRTCLKGMFGAAREKLLECLEKTKEACEMAE